jgi:hypothetical protein
MKFCPKCNILFQKQNFNKNANKKDGLQSWCKVCQSKETIKWARKNPLKHLNNKLKSLYKISLTAYNKMLKAQNYKCALCDKKNRDKRKLAVDHNHKTNRVRALLCVRCNTKLGIIEDKIFMRKALNYLRRF